MAKKHYSGSRKSRFERSQEAHHRLKVKHHSKGTPFSVRKAYYHYEVLNAQEDKKRILSFDERRAIFQESQPKADAYYKRVFIDP